MAKQATKTTALAQQQGGGLTIADDELAGLGGDLGYSTKSEDSLIPILSILQDISGEVKKGHSRRIDGAEAGHFIIRATKKVIDPGEAPLQFQPCAFQHVWVAWLGEPGEGKPVGTYPFDEIPKGAEQQKIQGDDGNERMTWIMPDGSRLVDTRYHYGLAKIDDVWQPLVIPFAGTNHTVSRGWTNVLKAQRLPNGQPAPAWFKIYDIDAHFNQRGQQSWYNYEIKGGDWVEDAEQRKAGRMVYDSFKGGKIAANVDSEAGDDTGDKRDIPI